MDDIAAVKEWHKNTERFGPFVVLVLLILYLWACFFPLQCNFWAFLILGIVTALVSTVILFVRREFVKGLGFTQEGVFVVRMREGFQRVHVRNIKLIEWLADFTGASVVIYFEDEKTGVIRKVVLNGLDRRLSGVLRRWLSNRVENRLFECLRIRDAALGRFGPRAAILESFLGRKLGLEEGVIESLATRSAKRDE